MPDEKKSFSVPRGTQDFMPEDMIRRNYVFATIKDVFERFGFDPIETPAFEEWQLLAAKSGEAIKDEIYYFKDKSDRELGLRFDLTVPLARIVATQQLAKPFRRYCIGRVWRYDKPGSGRKREFWQADVDIVGSSEAKADAECIAAVCTVLEELGIDFTVRINNRKLMDAFLKSIGADAAEVFRSIDKLEKIGREGVEKELSEKGIDSKKISKILKFIESDLKTVKQYIKESVEEINALLKALKPYGLDKKIKVDMSFVRGLEYYTGLVFEIVSQGPSIAGGGRYDDLVKQLGGEEVPATGISIGIERIMDIAKIDAPKTIVDIYIATVSNVWNEAVKIAKKLRKKLNVEIDASGRGLSKQLEYAGNKGIKKVIILGEKDLAEKQVTVRDMKTGEEKKIALGRLVKEL
ncbi:MAG: histidine--tRNA ligase [Candidatus Aenigmarchaeota archaeon]|nr:histidine--tRNA ligase [Candidatus Aenigmarchaeota archaeon]